ncbi:MAG: exosortase system-associated protein, TIGR04073 family [Desulfuromonadales bacterium]
MKKLLFTVLLLAAVAATPCAAVAEQQPDMIVEKMAIKFARGISNVTLSFVEIPKQHILAAHELGMPGMLVYGPLKAIGMTLYRGFIGATETIFFMVPQPGYYDPMIDPPYVWNGWDPKRDALKAEAEEKK